MTLKIDLFRAVTVLSSLIDPDVEYDLIYPLITELSEYVDKPIWDDLKEIAITSKVSPSAFVLERCANVIAGVRVVKDLLLSLSVDCNKARIPHSYNQAKKDTQWLDIYIEGHVIDIPFVDVQNY